MASAYRLKHVGKGGHRYPKKIHRWWIGAWWHRFQVARKRGVPQSTWNIYACAWGDDAREGLQSRRHWHIGRNQFPL